ncbi:flagellin [Telmatospirillum sp.]|uniref:flagellin n=1 Tax=Telmatospirillum sp. TaxID=2079197 RepID=UPI002852811A|nr:flagellin [Telmatospirillum sp.]
MTRVSTMQLNNLVVGSALSTQSQYAQASIQESSGLVASDFGTLGGASSNEMLNLEHDIEQSQTWASDATTVGNRTQSMYSAIGNMSTTLSSLETKISAAMSTNDNSTLASAVQSLQQTLVSEINTKDSAGYVFAGSNSATEPVTAASLATYQKSGGDKGSYYTGDDNILSVRVSPQQTISYGVTADSQPFEEAMRAVQLTSDAASSTLATSTATATGPSAATNSSVVTGGSLSITTGPSTSPITTSVTVSAGEDLQSIANDVNTAYQTASSTTGTIAKVVYSGSGTYSLQIASGDTNPLTISDSSGLGLPSSMTYASSFQTSLKTALTVANSSVKDLSNAQESLAAASSQLTTSGQQQTTYVTYLQNSLSSVKNVDTAQAAAAVSKYQTQLQASYLAVSQIAKINLASYL